MTIAPTDIVAHAMGRPTCVLILPAATAMLSARIDDAGKMRGRYGAGYRQALIDMLDALTEG